MSKSLRSSWIARSIAALSLSAAGSALAAPGGGHVYTMTNEASGNSVMVFIRGEDGALAFHDRFPTGGMGSGGGLGNQAGLVLAGEGDRLIAVNAGSNEVSVFRLAGDDLILRSIVPSGGDRPVSVTVHEGLVYVLNAGGAGSISGFEWSGSGELSPIEGSTRGLSGADVTAAAQVGFSPDGRFLVVTEKATNLIDVFPMNEDGTPGDAVVQASVGATPFGFSFTSAGVLIVSEAFGGAENASALSSYSIASDGTLNVISATVPTNQTAACWVELGRKSRFAYTTNTGSASISAYRVNRVTGEITLRDKGGRSGETTDGPIDLALAGNGRFLYTLDGASHQISAFAVDPKDGAMKRIEGGIQNLPPSANGMAAR